jgi:hypothetical protein
MVFLLAIEMKVSLKAVGVLEVEDVKIFQQRRKLAPSEYRVIVSCFEHRLNAIGNNWCWGIEF